MKKLFLVPLALVLLLTACNPVSAQSQTMSPAHSASAEPTPAASVEPDEPEMEAVALTVDDFFMCKPSTGTKISPHDDEKGFLDFGDTVSTARGISIGDSAEDIAMAYSEVSIASFAIASSLSYEDKEKYEDIPFNEVQSHPLYADGCFTLTYVHDGYVLRFELEKNTIYRISTLTPEYAAEQQRLIDLVESFVKNKK